MSQVDLAGVLNSMLANRMIEMTLLKKVEKLKMTPILIVEGIIVLNDPKVLELCDQKYFIKIRESVCWERRKKRVWDPEGSCWEESPGYFQSTAWPEYNKSLAELETLKDAGIKFMDSNQTSIEDNFVTILTDIVDRLDTS